MIDMHQTAVLTARIFRHGLHSAGRMAGFLMLGILSLAISANSSFGQDADAAPESKGKRQLIIHSDDAGMSHSVNLATIEGLRSGIVNSASIMVPCPWFKEFARFASENPQYDYGIHLTLTSEWDVYRWGPVASADKVPSLIDSEGYLWDNVPLVAENVKAEEVEIELRAQIDRALDFGVPLTHLDTHMGALFSRPDLIEVYVKLGVEYDLPILFLNELDDARAAELPGLKERFDAVLALLDQKGLPVLDAVLQFYGGDVPQEREKQYYDAIAGIGPGVTEMIIHCGINNAELQGITSSAARRDQDREIFTSQKMRDFLKEQNIELITWKQLRKQKQEGVQTR